MILTGFKTKKSTDVNYVVDLSFSIEDQKDSRFRPTCFIGSKADILLNSIKQFCQRNESPIDIDDITGEKFSELVKILNKKVEQPTIYIYTDIDKELTIEEQMTLTSFVNPDKKVAFAFCTRYPYMVTDCDREDVWIVNDKFELSWPNFQTYGSSINRTMASLFELNHTIPERIINTFADIEHGTDDIDTKIDKIADDSNFGDSVEKTLFLASLFRKQKEIETT